MKTVKDYLDSVSADRKDTFIKVLDCVRKNLPAGFEEGINYGMISFDVPLRTYPRGYLDDPTKPLPYVALASQKQYIALYHLGLYAEPENHESFIEGYKNYGYTHKIDVGKSCIRFKYMDEIPFDLIGKIMKLYSVDEWVDIYGKTRGSRGPRKKSKT